MSDLPVGLNQRADAFIEAAKEFGVWCFDVEHTPETGWSTENLDITGIGFSTKDMVFFERDVAIASRIIRTLFPLDLEVVAYNAKYDLKCLVSVKIITQYEFPENIRDPMVAANLLDETIPTGQLGLKARIKAVFGHEMKQFTEAWEYGRDSKEFENYAKEDAFWELKLYLYYKPLLKESDLFAVFSRILMPVTLTFADIELCGVGWNIAGARRLFRGFQLLRSEMKKEIFALIGNINLDSPAQLATRFFDELGYSTNGIERTPKGDRYAVNVKALDILAKKYKVARKIRTYRTSTKMISTYVEPLTRKALDDPHGRIHPSFWLTSATGRVRCTDPNFTNIPAWLDDDFAHLNIRKNVVPEPGYSMVVSDLSQIELRTCAHITKDRDFIRAFCEWNCKKCGKSGSSDTILHKCPNCGSEEDEKEGFWHGLDIHQLTTDSVAALNGDRRKGKQCNFAFIYYATPYRMHTEYPDFSISRWEKVREQYFDKYWGVRRYHDRIKSMVRSGRDVEVRDIFRRRRLIDASYIRQNEKHALNQLINFAGQSSGVGLIQLAMNRMRKKWIGDGIWMDAVKIINMIHDELVFEVKTELLDDIMPDIQYHMENIVPLRVPVRTESSIVDSWGNAK